MLIRLVKATVGNLEYNPKAQYKFHLIATWFWLVTMAGVPFIIHPHDNAAWVALLILEVSLYANFSTEFGAMSAAIAASQLPAGEVVKDKLPDFTNPNYLNAISDIGWAELDNEPAIKEAHF